MADAQKTPEWKQIVETKSRKEADLATKLRAARLARDAAAPPPEEPKKKTRKVAAKRAG